MTVGLRMGLALAVGLAAGVFVCGEDEAPRRVPEASGRRAASPRDAGPVVARDDGPAVAEIPPSPLVPMLTLAGFVNDVHDGDTLSVHFEFSARIRLIDCWAPELSTGEPGRRSKANLIRLTSGDSRCEVRIPLFDDLGRSTSLGRILARVRMLGQADDLSAQQVEGGFATRRK